MHRATCQVWELISKLPILLDQLHPFASDWEQPINEETRREVWHCVSEEVHCRNIISILNTEVEESEGAVADAEADHCPEHALPQRRVDPLEG